MQNCQEMGVSPFLLPGYPASGIQLCFLPTAPEQVVAVTWNCSSRDVRFIKYTIDVTPGAIIPKMGLCRFCYRANPLGFLAAALLMERGLSSACGRRPPSIS